MLHKTAQQWRIEMERTLRETCMLEFRSKRCGSVRWGVRYQKPLTELEMELVPVKREPAFSYSKRRPYSMPPIFYSLKFSQWDNTFAN